MENQHEKVYGGVLLNAVFKPNRRNWENPIYQSAHLVIRHELEKKKLLPHYSAASL
jgi:hypothetical protein